MSSLGRQVKTTEARAATSAALVAAVMPATFPAAVRAPGLVSCTTSVIPALARFAAIGMPMVPSPMNPTVSFMRAPSYNSDELLAQPLRTPKVDMVGGALSSPGAPYNAVAMREYRYQVDR